MHKYNSATASEGNVLGQRCIFISNMLAGLRLLISATTESVPSGVREMREHQRWFTWPHSPICNVAKYLDFELIFDDIREA